MWNNAQKMHISLCVFFFKKRNTHSHKQTKKQKQNKKQTNKKKPPCTCCWYSLYSSIHLRASLAWASTCWRNTRHLQTCITIKTIIVSLPDIYHMMHLMTGQNTWYDMLQYRETPHRKKVLLFLHCFHSLEPASPKKQWWFKIFEGHQLTDKITHHIWIMERLTGADKVFTMRDIITTKSFIVTLPGKQHIMC